MSQATKTNSELVQENELLRNLLLQIHKVTSQYFDVNANETSNHQQSNAMNTANEEGQRKRKRSTAKANGAKQKTQKMNPIVLLHNIDDAVARQSNSMGDELTGEDDMFTYLKLHKVSYSKRSRVVANETAPKPKLSPVKQLNATNSCLNTVTVLLDRLSQADIQKALGLQSPAPKKQPNMQPVRRVPRRKATPTDLKEMTATDMIKQLQN